MNSVRRLCVVVASAFTVTAVVPLLRAQEYEPTTAAGAFSDAELTVLKPIDAAIARFDALLATVKDVHEKAAVKNFLDALKDRRHQLRPGFDSSISDNLRLDVEIEYQRLVAWLAPIKPTRANRRDITIPLPQVAAVMPAKTTALTAAETKEGWQSLFDGQSLWGWRGYLRKDLPRLPYGWEVKDGVLHAIAADKKAGLKWEDLRKGELITERQFTDYELAWEWKVAKGANSGLKYLVTEKRANAPGPEFQMTDDLTIAQEHPDHDRLHDTAGFYGIIAPAKDIPLKPAGEWNTSRIVVRGKHVEHWHNGKKVMSTDLGSAEVKAGVAKSKFKDEPGFGEKIPGHIMLTYHGDEAWIRSIKIRELK
jgi:hypothetical protein